MEVGQARAKVGQGAASPTLELRRYAQQRKGELVSLQAEWLPEWRVVSDYIDPTRGRFDGPQVENKRKKRSRAKIINSTATQCVRVATAGMSSHMTSKARPWFKLDTPDPNLRKRQDVRIWLDESTTILRDTLAKSNFYKAMPVMYTEDLSFGVAVMMIAENEEEVARFHPLTCGTYAVGLDEAGKVDTLWRWYSRSARQLVQKYGELNEHGQRVAEGSILPEVVKRAYKENADRTFVVESLIEPNPEAQPGIGPLGVQAPKYRPYRELVWIEGSAEDRHGLLTIGGHYERPFVAIRFNPVGDDVYSTCPGLDTLGDIKQLQYLEGQKLLLQDMIADPPKNIPESMRNKGVNFRPGGRNYIPASQSDTRIEATYVPDYQAILAVKEDIRDVEGRLRQAFFYDLFLMLQSLGDQSGRTAAEIYERRDEKMSVLGPTLEIITDEGLDPTIVRVFRLLERAGRIPPVPEVLQNLPIKVEYTSILAQAMKASGLASIERATMFVANSAAAFPDVLDKYDADAAVDAVLDATGAPAAMFRDEDQVAAIREQRAQQQRQQQLMAAAPAVAQGAQAIKALNESVPQPGSVGEGLAEQLAGGQAA